MRPGNHYIIACNYQQAEFYLRELYPDLNPRHPTVIIVTSGDSIYRLRGRRFDPKIDVIHFVGTYWERPSEERNEIGDYLRMMGASLPEAW